MKALALCLFLWGSHVLAQDATGVGIGQKLMARTLICLDVESATRIASAHSKEGVEKAVELLKKEANCAIGVVHIQLKSVRASFPIEGGVVRVVEVLVEMRDDSWQTAFILTDQPIRGVHET